MPSIPTSIADVYRTHDVYADFAQEYRQAGSVPVQFLRVAQGPSVATDPAMHTFLLGMPLTTSMHTIKIDFGEGRYRPAVTAGAAYLHPTLNEADYTLEGHVDLLLLSTPLTALADVLDMEVAALNATFRPLHDRMVHDPLVRHLALSMWGMASTHGAQASLYIDQALMTLALHLALIARGADWRAGAGATLRTALVSVPGGLDAKRLARVREHVEADLAAPLTVADLAAAACLSPWHFTRAFKAATGETPHRFVMARRLARAREMLAATDDDLTSVALATGFASHAHLSASFKACFGVAPSAYRRLR